MDLLITLALTLILLLGSISQNIFVGWPLSISFILFVYLAYRRGFSTKAIASMIGAGAKKALIVVRIFVLIGAITGIWMSAGTVPSIVYYGILYMNPQLFILYAFLITSAVSFLIGTSFGTVGTVGVALILMAKSGQVDLNMAAGAIMAGAYFGDRCSPMSSSANLVAHVTGTQLYDNIKGMFKTAALPLILALIGYYYISGLSPLSSQSNTMTGEILKNFTVHIATLLPALSILVLALFRVNVKLSMGISIGLASVIALVVQHETPLRVLEALLLGFKLESSGPLQSIIAGGGVISMWKAAFVVTLSSALAGIFEGTNMLQSLENILLHAKNRFHQFLSITVVSFLTGSIGCNQAIAIILTEQLVRKSYDAAGTSKRQLALDLEDTGVVIAAITPWNIAAFVPTQTLGVSMAGFVPYAFYLYLIPITGLIVAWFQRKQKRMPT